MIPRFGMASGGAGGVSGLRHDWTDAVKGPTGIVVVGYMLLMLATAMYMRFRGDVDPIGMLLLFGPRTYLVWPWIVLLILAFMKSWRTGIVAIAGSLVTLFGVAQFEVPLLWPAHSSHRAFRIVTYNADVSSELSLRIRQDIEAWNADIILLQGCARPLAEELRTVPSYSVHTTGEFCMVVRGTLEGVDTMPPKQRHGRAGYDNLGNVLRYRVRIGGTSLPVYSVHLDSPRTAIWKARHLDFSQLIDNINSRGVQSSDISQFVRRSDSAFVVAGDFNTPYGSQFLRRNWSDLSNAFSEVGTGFGTTMRAGLFRVRIDHVLVPRTLVPTEVKILSDFPSEHQPLIVDLAWR
ncbi:MAG: endonuclease/exonuclease/phosphatase family protein [Gemmatimonadaceae bacterium]